MTAHSKNSSSNSGNIKRIAANTKERERVQRMNKAFVELKNVLPKMVSATKMDLLSSAKDHIEHLTNVLQETFGKDIKLILNEYKLRKVCGIRTSQLMSYKELPDAMIAFSAQSPKSTIPFQEEITSSSDFMNPNSTTNDWVFLNPSPVTCPNIFSQILPHEAPQETVFDFAVQNPKSTIPFQNETTSNSIFLNQGHVTDELGVIIGTPLSEPQNYSQETANNSQSLVQTFVKPETWNQYPKPAPFPNHRNTIGENISNSNIGLGVPSMACITQCSPSHSQDIRQSNTTQVMQPTLSDELDQFCFEIFDMIPSAENKLGYEDYSELT